MEKAGPPPKGPNVRYTDIWTPLGRLLVAWTPQGLCRVERADAEGAAAWGAPAAQRDDTCRPAWENLFRRWFAGEPVDVPVDLSGLTDFERQVLQQVRRIPRGQVRTYGEIARLVGRPRAARAVGNAVAKNPVPFLIPCHRVVRSGGQLGHYSGGGPALKAWLLRLEGAQWAASQREVAL